MLSNIKSMASKVSNMLGGGDARQREETNNDNYNVEEDLIYKLERQGCRHIVMDILSHLDPNTLAAVGQTYAPHMDIVDIYRTKYFKQLVHWTGPTKPEDGHIQNSFLEEHPGQRHIIFRQSPLDHYVVWLEGDQKYLTREYDGALGMEICQLNSVCWLFMVTKTIVTSALLKSVARENSSVVITGRWMMKKYGASMHNDYGRNLPKIKLEVRAKDTPDKLLSSTEVLFRALNELSGEWSFSHSASVSFDDLDTDLEIKLVYDDTVNNWWKSSLQWAFSEIRISSG